MTPKAESYKPKFCAQIGKRLKTIVITAILIGFGGWCGVSVISGSSASASQADAAKESWQTEFDNLCAKTEDAMTFSQEELTDLIRRCDGLRPQIEKLDESRKKVYLERLRKCRGLYEYVLEAKKKDKK